MKKLLMVCLLLMPTMAVAQVATELNFKITTSEAELIWKGIRKLPVEDVENLMLKLRQQAQEQNQPKPIAPVEVPKKED